MNEKERISDSLNELHDKITDKISEKFDGKKGRELLNTVLLFMCKGLLWSAYSFLLASCPTLFSTYPLGIALLCALSDNVFFIFIGTATAAVAMPSELSAVFFLMYVFIFGIRFITSKWLSDVSGRLFHESYAIRCIIALFASFVIGIYRCFSESFSLFSFGGLVFSSLVSFGLAFVFTGNHEIEDGFRKTVSGSALAFCFVLSMSKYGFFGYSLGFASCTAVSIFVSYKSDLLHATVISLICGIACGEPVLAPMFAVIALFCGIIKKFNSKIAIPSALLIGAAYAFWIFGTRAFTYVLPDLVGGAVVIFPIKYFTEKNKKAEKEIISENETEYKRDGYGKKDAELISENMALLADTLDSLSDKLREPTYSDVKSMCKTVCEDGCSKCSAKKKCYAGLDYSESDILKKMSGYLYETGYLTSADLPRTFLDSCRNSEKILNSLNREYGKALKERMSEDRTKAFACGYSCVARLISESVKRKENEAIHDAALTEKTIAELKKLNIQFDSASVTGSRRKSVTVKGIADISLKLSGNRINEIFNEICGVPMSPPYIEYALGKWRMTLESQPLISCRCAMATKAKDGEDVCGDTLHCFSSDEGFFYCILSDGMGSGRQAALVSRICCTFAERLSLAGGSLKTVVETINNYILSQNYECCATIDFLKIDLYTSNACFVKSGAASSMVIRDGHIFRIDSATVPVGAIREINTEQITFPVEPGDYIVMTSDGVNPDFESSLLTADIVNKSFDLTLEALAENIISDACKNGKRPDDMSVSIIKIENERH